MLVDSFQWNFEEFVEWYSENFHGIFYHSKCVLDNGFDVFTDPSSLAVCFPKYRKHFNDELDANERKDLPRKQDPAWRKNRILHGENGKTK
jgi:hypothetical protein